MPLVTLLATLACLPVAQDDPEPCHIHGVLVDESGQPVAGATVSISGWGANNDREREFGRPKNWTNPPPVTTEDDGQFSFQFVPPQAFQFVVDVEAPGKGSIGWRWGRVKHGEELDLGRSVLEPAAILTGYIVDGDGALLVDGWRVSAWHSWNSRIGGRSSQGEHTTVDPETGRFRIDGLPPGELRVTAQRGSTHIPEAKIVTKVGEDTELVLRYEGPDVNRRLVVTVFSRPFYPFEPAPGTVHAVGGDGTKHPLVPAPGRANDWHVLDLEPGPYRIEFTDPRFEDFTIEELRTGGTGRAMLKGSAALRVAVVDGDTGDPVTDYALDVGFTNVNFSPSTFRVREADTALPLGGLYHGIVPGNVELTVMAEGWPDARAEVVGLEPGETRDVEVRLTRGLTLEGRVVGAEGQPLADVEVQLTRGKFPGHDDPDRGSSVSHTHVDGVPMRVEIAYRDAAARTDETGTFRFEGLAQDEYSLLAVRGPAVDSHAIVTIPATDPIVLTLPAVAAISGTVILPEGVPFDSLRVEAVPEGGQAYSVWRSARRHGATKEWLPDADGRLPSREYPVGRYELIVSRVIVHEQGDFRSESRDRIHVQTVVIDEKREVAVDLDLRDIYPVPLTLRIGLPEGLAGDDFYAYVELTPVGAEQAVFASSESRVEEATLIIDTSGQPRPLKVNVRGLGFNWESPKTIHPKRGVENVFELDAPFIYRALALRQADGTPLAESRVVLWGEGEPRFVRETDELGQVQIFRTAGTLSIAPLPPPDEEDEEVKRARHFGYPPPVTQEAMNAVEAAATLEFVAGKEPIAVNLSGKKP